MKRTPYPAPHTYFLCTFKSLASWYKEWMLQLWALQPNWIVKKQVLSVLNFFESLGVNDPEYGQDHKMNRNLLRDSAWA